jgi:hypothetical protein
MERRYKNEKLLREKAEEKLLALRRKHRLNDQGAPDPDILSLGTQNTGERFSRGNSFDDANELVRADAVGNAAGKCERDAIGLNNAPADAHADAPTGGATKGQAKETTDNQSPLRGNLIIQPNQSGPRPHGTQTPQRGNGTKDGANAASGRPIRAPSIVGNGTSRASTTGTIVQPQATGVDTTSGEVLARDAGKPIIPMSQTIARMGEPRKRAESSGRGPIINFDPLGKPHHQYHDSMSECGSTIASEPDRSLNVHSAHLFMMDSQHSVTGGPVTTGTMSQGLDGDLMTFQAPAVQSNPATISMHRHQLSMEQYVASGDSGMLFAATQMTFSATATSSSGTQPELIFQQDFGTNNSMEHPLKGNHMLQNSHRRVSSMVQQVPSPPSADPFDELVQTRSTKPAGNR